MSGQQAAEGIVCVTGLFGAVISHRLVRDAHRDGFRCDLHSRRAGHGLVILFTDLIVNRVFTNIGEFRFLTQRNVVRGRAILHCSAAQICVGHRVFQAEGNAVSIRVISHINRIRGRGDHTFVPNHQDVLFREFTVRCYTTGFINRKGHIRDRRIAVRGFCFPQDINHTGLKLFNLVDFCRGNPLSDYRFIPITCQAYYLQSGVGKSIAAHGINLTDPDQGRAPLGKKRHSSTGFRGQISDFRFVIVGSTLLSFCWSRHSVPTVEDVTGTAVGIFSQFHKISIISEGLICHFSLYIRSILFKFHGVSVRCPLGIQRQVARKRTDGISRRIIRTDSIIFRVPTREAVTGFHEGALFRCVERICRVDNDCRRSFSFGVPVAIIGDCITKDRLTLGSQSDGIAINIAREVRRTALFGKSGGEHAGAALESDAERTGQRSGNVDRFARCNINTLAAYDRRVSFEIEGSVLIVDARAGPAIDGAAGDGQTAV